MVFEVNLRHLNTHTKSIHNQKALSIREDQEILGENPHITI